jgi:hypothetical protein
MYRAYPHARAGVGIMLEAYGAFWPPEMEDALLRAVMIAYATSPPGVDSHVAAAVDAFADRIAVVHERLEAGDEAARAELPPERKSLQSDVAYLRVFAKELRGEDVLA